MEFADGVAPGESGTPRGQPLAEPAAALTTMLAGPIDYPSLARSITPADRIVLALDRSVPQAAQIAVAAVRALVEAGVAPDGISILRSDAGCDAGSGDPFRNLLASPLWERIALLDHDPNDR